jgi:hypothetical protein
MGSHVDALDRAYRLLGLEDAADGEVVIRQLVIARIIEPASSWTACGFLDEAGIPAASHRTVKRRLPACAEDAWRQRLSAACAAHARLGLAGLVLYDVSTLCFETDQGDGFREPGFSKERRLEPQIIIGLLADRTGFPLMVSAFEGNKAETKTMLPAIEKFMAAHQLPDVTVVADAGMISDANTKAIEAAGLSFILGMKVQTFPMSWTSGGGSTPARRFPTGASSPSPGPPGRRTSAATGSSTTPTRPTGHGGRCTGSTGRSPRPSRRSPG